MADTDSDSYELTAKDRAVAARMGRIGADRLWATVKDRSAHTAPGRAAFMQRFLDECDGDEERAKHARRAYFARLALKSAKTRRARKGLTS